MKCTDIPAFLHEYREDKSCCAALAEALGGPGCEQESVVPRVSPGVVQADECLVRYLLNSDIDDTPEGGKVVKPSAFSHAGTNGLSVDRYRHRSKARAGEVAQRYVGYVVATCTSVREEQADGKRCFAVYDTALIENPAHADVCQCLFTPKSHQAKYRRQLKDTFERVPKLFTDRGVDGVAPVDQRKGWLGRFFNWIFSLLRSRAN